MDEQKKDAQKMEEERTYDLIFICRPEWAPE